MAISDFPYTYGTQPVYDPVTDQVVENAVGGQLVSANGTPYPIGDLNGNPIAQITSNGSGMSSQFRSTVPSGLIKFGDLLVTVFSNEVAQFAVNAQGAITIANAALAAAQDAINQVNDLIAQGGTGGGGLPAGTTLEDIPNGATRLAMTLAERNKLAATPTTFLTLGTTATTAKPGNYTPTPAEINAVESIGMDARIWFGRTTAQGPPTEAEGAKRGTDYCFLDVVA